MGCSLLTDPAVRLANCTRKASPTNLTLLCDPQVKGGYVAVLHPPGELSNRQLLAAGLPQELVVTVGQLRLGSNAAILVIPFSPTERPSRTTSQMHYVLIPKAIVAKVPPGQLLKLSLTVDGYGTSVAAADPVPR